MAKFKYNIHRHLQINGMSIKKGIIIINNGITNVQQIIVKSKYITQIKIQIKTMTIWNLENRISLVRCNNHNCRSKVNDLFVCQEFTGI